MSPGWKFWETGAASQRAMASLGVAVAACTDLGLKRPNNEDNFLIFDVSSRSSYPLGKEIRLKLPPLGLLIGVADGMGGHQSGQVASALCMQNLPLELQKALPSDGLAVDDQGSVLAQAVRATNSVVWSAATQNSDYNGMGTTLTAALICDAHIVIAQVGDSRAYLYHEGELCQLTQDQTVGNSLQALHQPVQADSRLAEMLVQAVGAVKEVEVAITHAELAPGDQVLICCDGLYKVLSFAEISDVLRGSPDPLAKAKQFIARTLEGGAPDNVTVVVLEVR